MWLDVSSKAIDHGRQTVTASRAKRIVGKPSTRPHRNLAERSFRRASRLAIRMGLEDIPHRPNRVDRAIA